MDLSGLARMVAGIDRVSNVTNMAFMESVSCKAETARHFGTKAGNGDGFQRLPDGRCPNPP